MGGSSGSSLHLCSFPSATHQGSQFHTTAPGMHQALSALLLCAWGAVWGCAGRWVCVSTPLPCFAERRWEADAAGVPGGLQGRPLYRASPLPLRWARIVPGPSGGESCGGGVCCAHPTHPVLSPLWFSLCAEHQSMGSSPGEWGGDVFPHPHGFLSVCLHPAAHPQALQCHKTIKAARWQQGLRHSAAGTAEQAQRQLAIQDMGMLQGDTMLNVPFMF